MRFRMGGILRLRFFSAWLGGVALPLLSRLPISAMGTWPSQDCCFASPEKPRNECCSFAQQQFPKCPGA